MQRIWLSQYPPGVPHEIDFARIRSLVQLCDDACREFPRARAFGNFGSYLTFAQTDTLSRSFARFLQRDIGIAKGDRVALMMPNILQYPVALFGVLRAGGLVVNANPQYTARELLHQLSDSGARCIVAFSSALDTVSAIAGQTKLEHVVITELGDLFSFPKSIVFNRAARRRHAHVDAPAGLPSTRFNAALKRGAAADFVAPAIDHDDLAFLQYTGGTTGVSKGAMLSHGNIIANAVQVGSWFHNSIDSGREVVVTALPLYHIYALTVNCIAFFSYGALNYLITDPRDTVRFVRELRRIRFTGIAGVNTLFQSLLSQAGFKDVDFSHLKYTSGGGAAIHTAVAAAWERHTGSIISQGYGLTEASPVVCVNPFELKEFTGCIGLPVPSTDCRIVDADGAAVGVGERGELCVRGPQVMRGYWRREADNAEVFDDDGWLRTGDIAEMREDGFFSIVDRKKDMILVSGFNVYPNEIEDIVVSHPGISEAVVIGITEGATEAVKVVAIRADPTLEAHDIVAFCREHLTGYKIPRHIEFVDELPKSNIGKILRREVRERYGKSV